MRLPRAFQFTFLFSALLLLAFSLAAPVRAAAIVVNDLGDTTGTCATNGTGTCTLRDAITFANTDPGTDTITFSVTGTINLGGVLPDLTTSMDITGPGADQLTVRRDTGGNYRIFLANGSSLIVTISGITISNGSLTGGAVSASGGGLRIDGTSNNVTLQNVVVSGNQVDGFGGGLSNGSASSTLNVIAGTLTGNISVHSIPGGSGAAIDNVGILNVTNSTISDNSSNLGDNNAGGIWNSTGSVTILNSTLTNNTGAGSASSGGIYMFSGILSLKNTIVAGNNASGGASDIYKLVAGTVTSQGFNLIGDNTGVTTEFPAGTPNANNDYVGTSGTPLNPLLDSLDNYGGPTQTHALFPGSAALNHGTDTGAPTTDQRGVTRPAGAYDIGAFERESAQTGPNFVVTHTADTDSGVCGPVYCTLREAMNAANFHSGADTITFLIPDTDANCNAANVCAITLGAQLPAIDDSTLTIDGSANSGEITVSGNDLVRILQVNAGNVVTVNTLTLVHGNATDCPVGGTDFRCGGAIYSEGTLNVYNSTFTDNHAFSALADGLGGAITIALDSLFVANSTFTSNEVSSSGGAIAAAGASATINNSTFDGNFAPSSGADVLNDQSTTVLNNNILTTTSGGTNCYNVPPATLTGVNNLIDDTSCGSGATFRLGAVTGFDFVLADNGGPTQTFALLNNSNAIDLGDKTICADTNTVNNRDQRGNARDDLRCDVGAFEFVNSDGHTVIKDSLQVNTPYSFGPTLARIVLTSGDPGELSINRELTAPGNSPPANALPITWDATSTASPFSITFTLCYDPSVLSGQDESTLRVYHYNGSSWDNVGGTLDDTNYLPYHCVTASLPLTSLSPLILAPGSPTAVDVAGFGVRVNKKHAVVVKWETMTEARIAGFNVYRRMNNGQWAMVNGKFIQAKHAGDVAGAKYRRVDRKVTPGKTYKYKIQVMYLDGHSEFTEIEKVRVPR